MPQTDRVNDPIPLPGRRGAYPPLTPAQRALWYLDRLHPDTALYNVPFAVGLTGQLDPDALGIALRQVVARHEPLRTSFGMHGDQPYQRISPPGEVPLPVADLTDLPISTREGRCAGLLEKWSQEPFDLADGPLFRARLIRFAADEHVLGLYLHHAVCDGLSVRLLLDELGEAYEGGAARPPLRTQFADWASWLHREPVDESRIEWWRAYLDGACTSLTFPASRPVASTRLPEGRAQGFTLARSAVDKAINLARVKRTTPFVVMLTAYAVLLGHLTGEQQALVGVPVSSRPFPELEQLIGLFVNTVPVRADLSGDPTFGELVTRMRRSLLAALDHQVPFDTLVSGLRVDRSASRTPLVQVAFGFEEHLAERRFGGLTTRLLPFGALPAKFDIDMTIVSAAGDGDYEAVVSYAADLLIPEDAARLAELFSQVLAGAEDPSLRLSDLLRWREAADPSTVRPRRTPPRPTGTPVHELFVRQAQATPDAPAILDGDVTVTYAELHERSDAVARRLRAAGVRADEPVGILLPRCAGGVTAVLGILKAAAAYLALDLRHSSAHACDLVARSGGRVIVTDMRTAVRYTGLRIALVCIDELGPGGPTTSQQPETRPDGLAYVSFTSASTGPPKGVAVGHRALVNHAQAMMEKLELTSDDRVLQFANLTFDVAAEEIFPTLLVGACIVISPDPPAPAEATSLLERGHVTVANLPSSYWQRWAASLDATAEFPLPALRLLVIGSERVAAASVAAWRRWPGIPLVNAYGLTETTITALVHEVGDEFSTPVVPVGTPIDGVDAYVLDTSLRPVCPGVEGELYIGGIGLARGYIGLPGSTADRFVPDPFTPVPGTRMHRTGDRARLRADRTIEVLGRLDDQLKVNGYRIEPSQVETSLAAHPGVAQAAVAVHGETDGTPRLIGYVVMRDGSTELPADLRAHLAMGLPFHLVPGLLVALTELPVTANGKIDRTALPRPAEHARSALPTPPSTPWERRLCEIWEDILGVTEIGVDDNFFDMGSDSYTLATVHSRIGDLAHSSIPLITLYECPTIAALAGRLSGIEERSETAGSEALSKELRRGLNRLGRLRRARS